MGIVSNILLPRRDNAAIIAKGIRQAHDDIKNVSTLFHPDNFQPETIDDVVGMVAVNHPAIANANQVVGAKSLTKALSPRGLAPQITPQAVIDAQAALVQARFDIAIPKGALKHPEKFGKQPAIDIRNRLTDLSQSMLEAHLAVTDAKTAKSINSAAPVRKVQAVMRLGALGAATGVGGLFAATAITGNDYVTAARDQAASLLP